MATLSFEKKVQKFIEEEQLVEAGDRLLIACSGGVDSMGLLHFFLHFQKIWEIDLYVAHVDHMLRGEVSYEDRLFVERFCQEKNLPIFSTSIPIPEILKKEGGNAQAVCRRERYAYFAEMMKQHKINKLVTAHHADDQLETMLMALTRSGSVGGFKGISSKRTFAAGTIIRPFLTVTKEEIRKYLEGQGGTFREDASNLKDDYTRNRFRHHIVPLLKKENPQVAVHAFQLSQSLQQDDEYLNELALSRFSFVVEKAGDGFILHIQRLQKEPLALQRRIILILLNYLYRFSDDKGFSICSKILELCKSQEGNAMIHLPDQYIANRSYDIITFFKYRASKADDSIQTVEIGEWNVFNGFRLYIGKISDETANFQQNATASYYFNSDSIAFPLKVRNRKEGDRIHLKGMHEAKRLSRLFIDEKIPLIERDDWPILVDSKDEILAVVGIRANHRFSKAKRMNDDMVMIIQKVFNNK
ncbi:tRNA lysidine(34) synthetase TilS [Ureibacillus sp. FSL K6-8385]|mgnify:CR=1 FL=1|uniref:tRNA(Ile)-lysidine synthase n=1 Tax=Ureibacillus terrenus TaxID=118246 RepID=A0A540UZR0_9BACL|nr:tRNA lysidine(34) synthetase TilS [Ureibacillus terrenus]MED3763193.1 tRNA lysidine(34) synthetase TilS [Ureibacillus terrenus]TQE89463.1 tRNA lysidine(34) synthetase TilS [Ureibacillus terrenus]